MDRLKRATRDYWDAYEPSEIDAAMQRYICDGIDELNNQSLLEAELEHARRTRNITARPCETLVLMVGHSLEPLLQSVCVYEPQKVVLLLNEDGYGPEEEWHVFAGHLTEAIEHLVSEGLLDQHPEIPGEGGDQGYAVADTPEAVFRRLVEVLADETDVVIDVTGGKKSMVSGAYLYAAYAGTRISYVDFDEYDPEYRRPYGYSCKIGGLSNPYDAFVLREWEFRFARMGTCAGTV